MKTGEKKKRGGFQGNATKPHKTRLGRDKTSAGFLCIARKRLKIVFNRIPSNIKGLIKGLLGKLLKTQIPKGVIKSGRYNPVNSGNETSKGTRKRGDPR